MHGILTGRCPRDRGGRRVLKAKHAGLAGGILWALSDWAASGLVRVPAVLVLATLAAGLLAGLLAEGLAARVGRPPLAPALVLAGGLALEGLATASKDLAGGARIAAAALVALAALAGLRLARRASVPATLAAVVALPCGAFLGAWTDAGPWAHLAGLVLPLAWLAAVGGARAAVGATVAAALRVAVVATALVALVLAQRGAAQRAPRSLAPAGTSAGARPNVVLVVIDTLRADALAPDGPVAAFARGGVDFRRCSSAAPWTLPAMGALLTGLYPSEHGAVTAATPLADELTTLAEHLHAAGYATAAFTGGAFVGPAHRMDQGFETFDATSERAFGPFAPHVPLVWRVARNRYVPQRWLVRLADEQRGLAGVLGSALRWAEGEPRRPKLLLLHTYQVHDYYLYDPDTDDAVLEAGPSPSARFAGRLSVHPSELLDASAADLAHFRALYDARVAAIERLFPRLVAELEAALGGETLWIVTADHGEGFDAERGRVHHGGRLHEDLLHVPLVLRGPGLPAGRVVDAPVRSIDVLPTVLDLLDLPASAGISGESLLPALGPGDDGLVPPFPRVAFAEERAHGFELLSARIGARKAIRSAGGAEHFDLAEDPLETTPLDRSQRDDLLQDALDAFAETHPARASAEIELDAATREHLRSLGYVE
jgi:arylsulfatase A-like enzyme